MHPLGPSVPRKHSMTTQAFYQLGEFSITQKQMLELEQTVKLNPIWAKQISLLQLNLANSILKTPRPATQTVPRPLSQSQANLFQTKLKEIENFYKQHNIDGAFKSLQELKFGAPSIYSDQHGHQGLFHRVERQYNDMIECSAAIAESGWVIKDESGGVKIFQRSVAGQMIVLIESKVTAPVQIFLQSMVELDYFSKIVPMVQLSEEVRSLSRNMKLGHFIVSVPILASKQAFYQGVGYDRLGTNGTIFLYVRSVHDSPKLMQELNFHPKFSPKTQPLNFKFIALEYTPMTPTTGRCKLCLNVNLDMKLIPKWIMDKVMRTFAFKIFQNIVKVSKNFKGSVWEKRAIQKPQLFNFFKQRSSQYFGGL